MEDVVAREVICEWNAQHSWEERKALLPRARGDSSSSASFSRRESDESAGASDLLVAFFCAVTGAPGQAAIEPEIERQLREKRPVLIYFSEGRADIGPEARTFPRQEELRRHFGPEALIESYRDEKEFRSRFAQALERLLCRHPFFRLEGEFSPETAAPLTVEEHPLAAPAYSRLAQSLLVQACDDPEAYIGHIKDSRGLKIQVNGRQVVDQAKPETMAEWEEAFQELVRAGLVRDAGCNGQLFQISHTGFQFLETLGKYPIGYIAELGSV